MTMIEETPPEELENKISEAELEAQKEEPTVVGEISPTQEEATSAAAVEAPPEKKGLSRVRKIWRWVLVWLVVIAIAFAGGFFLDTRLRYQPEQERSADLSAEIEVAQGEIATLNAEVERLGEFEDRNKALTAEIDQLNIHLVLLSVRVGVADASLALEQNRRADANLTLTKVGSTLETLQGLLTPEEAEVVANMIQRYELIMLELKNDGTTVLTDLELLETKLQALENTLFASP